MLCPCCYQPSFFVSILQLPLFINYIISIFTIFRGAAEVAIKYFLCVIALTNKHKFNVCFTNSLLTLLVSPSPHGVIQGSIMTFNCHLSSQDGLLNEEMKALHFIMLQLMTIKGCRGVCNIYPFGSRVSAKLPCFCNKSDH